jgi:monofunctional biosynthetic peptidoglycan transglycosylase
MTFSGGADEPAWIAVNDGVMGGLSRGAPRIVDGQLRFSGTVSLENNGGFSSVRTTGRVYDLSGAKAILLRVEGDGRTYQLRLATDARVGRSAVSYSADVPTSAGKWTEVRIPFATLVPTFRGERLNGPPLDLARVEEVGLLIGDGRAGPFALVVEWIKVE